MAGAAGNTAAAREMARAAGRAGPCDENFTPWSCGHRKERIEQEFHRSTGNAPLARSPDCSRNSSGTDAAPTFYVIIMAANCRLCCPKPKKHRNRLLAERTQEDDLTKHRQKRSQRAKKRALSRARFRYPILLSEAVAAINGAVAARFKRNLARLPAI